MKKLLLIGFILLCLPTMGAESRTLVEVLNEDVQENITLSGNLNVTDLLFNRGDADYKYLIEDFDDLALWSTSGTVVLADNVVTLSAAWSNIQLQIYDVRTYMPPADEVYIVEMVMTVATGNTASIVWFDEAVTIQWQAAIHNDNITFMSQDNGITVAANPTNFDSTAKFKIKILVDPSVGDAKIYLYHQDTYTTIYRLLTTTSFVFDVFAKPGYLRFESGATAGAVTIERVRIHSPWGVAIGDSLITGMPHYYPVPSMSQWPGCSIPLWIEKHFGNKAEVINQGIEGHKLTHIEARQDDMVLKFKPEWVFLHIGSNDIHDAVPIAEMQVSLANVVDAWTAAGSKVVIFEVLPRVDFTSGENFIKHQWNAWIATFADARQDVILITDHDALESQSVADAMAAHYTADGLHINARASRLIGNMVNLKMRQRSR